MLSDEEIHPEAKAKEKMNLALTDKDHSPGEGIYGLEGPGEPRGAWWETRPGNSQG